MHFNNINFVDEVDLNKVTYDEPFEQYLFTVKLLVKGTSRPIKI
jgi:hypothetical protein